MHQVRIEPDPDSLLSRDDLDAVIYRLSSNPKSVCTDDLGGRWGISTQIEQQWALQQLQGARCRSTDEKLLP